MRRLAPVGGTLPAGPIPPDALGPVAPSDLSVVICAYTLDRWEDICRAVASVQAQASPVRETILVVDYNEALLTKAADAFPAVRVVANTDTRGLSGARNTGVAHATGDVVAFLDDDAAAAPDWAEHLADGYAEPGVLGVGGYAEAEWLEKRPSWFPAEFGWVIGCSYTGLPTELSQIRNMIGANMSLRRVVFDVVGGFDARVGRIGTVPVGCEETELCIRAVARWPGSRFVYQPLARVGHHVPPGRGTWRYFRTRCFADGRSKARVTRLAGASAGLSAERRYVRRVLPAGFLRGLRDGALGRRRAPLARSGAIVAGLAFTTAGYIHGLLFDRAADAIEAMPQPIPSEGIGD